MKRASVLILALYAWSTPTATLASPVSAGPQARPLLAPDAEQAGLGGGLVTLKGNTRPEAKTTNDRGRVSDDLMLNHMILQLRRTPEREQALQQFIKDIHNPTSPLFHHWITAVEFGQTYGATSTGIAAATAWLQSQGFRVNLVYPNQMVIDFTGSAGQIREAFRTEIHHLVVNGQAHIANMSDPQIPAALASTVAGVVSLNDFHPRPLLKRRADYTVGTGYYAVVPADLATIYNLNPAFAAGYSGQGQTIVLIEDTDLYTAADWSTFRSVMGLTSAYPLGSLSQVHPPSSPTNNCTDPGYNGDDIEATLDVEWASAAAPSAAIELASCSDTYTNFGGFIALQNLLNGSKTPPAIVSISYGESESYLGASLNAYISSLYQQAVAEGVSVFVSSGDEGAASSDANQAYAVRGITVSGFTSTPYNVSVGGTDFGDTYERTNTTYWNSTNTASYGSALSYVPEIPWNDSCASVLIGDYLGVLPAYGSGGLCQNTGYLTTASGSGGPSGCAIGAPDTGGVVSGTCAGYAKPSWQSGFTGNPSDGVRDIPMFRSSPPTDPGGTTTCFVSLTRATA
jgi:subtilase family serine protease